MGLTREEEIKARLETYTVFAEMDIKYLLARNEELQRRVERFEAAVLKVRDDPYVYSVSRVMQILNDAMDAKEQDDDQAD